MIEKSLEYFKNRLSKTLSDKRREAYQDAMEALEKQVPKKIEAKKRCSSKCPTCGYELSVTGGNGYYAHPTFLCRCPNPDCGQRLDWSE